MARRVQVKRAGRGKAKGTKASANLEVIGLVLLALGVLLLGLLLPLPLGELGALMRELFVGQIGSGAYLLPGPPLVLGGLFLLGKNPQGWPRVLLAYAVTGFGVWLLASLLAPALGGAWGRQLYNSVGGATGVLASVLALLIILVGIDILLKLPPTTLLRRAFQRSAEGVKRAFYGGAAARRKVKTRAAFGADVALVKGRLRGLSSDLTALGELYPGSAELGKWQEMVGNAHSNLRWADADILRDTQTDAGAWEGAVSGFAHARAAELAAQVEDEELPDFEARQDTLFGPLTEPLSDRTLDGVRKLLGLGHTALGERYSRLLRERDLAAASLSETTPKQLVRATQAHGDRTNELAEVEGAQVALADDTALLGPWAALLERVAELRSAYPRETALETFDAELRALLKKGRSSLAELDAQTRNLNDLETTLDLMTADVTAPEPVGGAFPDAATDKPEVGLENSEPEAGVPEIKVPEADTPEVSVSKADAPETSEAAAPWNDLEPEPEREPIPEVGGIPIQLPPLDLLDAPQHTDEDPAAQRREVSARITKIDETLANFRLQGRVVASVRGPTVTRFEVEPAPGEKISRFSGLSDDLALAMAVGSVRIEAPIPGKSVIGLEVPNASRDLIRFREAAEAPAFRRAKARLPLILGKSIDGEMVVGDLARMPHLLIAGSTGSGKSVAVNTLVGSLLYRFLPTDLRFLMIDPKMVELTPFDGVPHLLRPVVTNPNDAAGVLLGLVAHMERRYKMMSKIGAKNLDQYNQKARTLDMPELPFIIIIIDELADLMITSPKEVESAIMRLAQMARATGMHLVLATQRPSVDILTSLIKVNVPARVAFAVSSGHDSRTILDTMGAERLTGMGDMLFYQPGLPKPVRLQGPFISEEEIFTLANFLRRQYFDDDFAEAYGSDFDPPPLDESSASGLIDWNDDKLREAAELVINEGQASVSRLQRRLSVGHARAGKLMDSLEALGVVGVHSGSKPRDVIAELHELPNIFGK